MDHTIKMRYETENGTSFLVAELEEEMRPIPYQIGMIENNEIKCLLKPSTYREDGISFIRYNVTSKIPLSQVLDRQKMTKNDYITLLDGVLNCYRELPEYELPTKGVLLEEDHIFIRSGSFLPNLVYLPIYSESGGIEDIKAFARKLIMESRIESTRDNFVQRVLDVLNKVSTVEQMQTQIREIRGEKKSEQPPAVQGKPAAMPAQPATEPRETAKPAAIEPLEPEHFHYENAVEEKKYSLSTRKKEEIKKNPVNQKKRDKAESERKRSGSDIRRVILLSINGALIILTALLFSRGFFRTPENGLNVSYLFGFALLFAGANVVAYRELFVNQKGGKSNATKRKPTKKPALQHRTESKKPEAAPKRRLEDATEKAVVPPVADAAPVTPKAVPSAPPSMPVIHPEMQVRKAEEDNGDTIADDDTNLLGEPYLEYYENGLVRRVRLKEGTTRVGANQKMVDHCVNSNRVSKIHADFIREGNRFFVQDINSKNGTFINGSKDRIVSNELIEIFPGDHIRLSSAIDMVLNAV